jgi:copper oxidase (laccase) domain-containing protein
LKQPILRTGASSSRRNARVIPGSTCRVYIVARLEAAGVGQVTDLALCTYSDEDRFFSYRRATHRGEPDYGRLLAAISLIET